MITRVLSLGRRKDNSVSGVNGRDLCPPVDLSSLSRLTHTRLTNSEAQAIANGSQNPPSFQLQAGSGCIYGSGWTMFPPLHWPWETSVGRTGTKVRKSSYCVFFSGMCLTTRDDLTSKRGDLWLLTKSRVALF
jgi:hypothetical protein